MSKANGMTWPCRRRLIIGLDFQGCATCISVAIHVNIQVRSVWWELPKSLVAKVYINEKFLVSIRSENISLTSLAMKRQNLEWIRTKKGENDKKTRYLINLFNVRAQKVLRKGKPVRAKRSEAHMGRCQERETTGQQYSTETTWPETVKASQWRATAGCGVWDTRWPSSY